MNNDGYSNTGIEGLSDNFNQTEGNNKQESYTLNLYLDKNTGQILNTYVEGDAVSDGLIHGVMGQDFGTFSKNSPIKSQVRTKSNNVNMYVYTDANGNYMAEASDGTPVNINTSVITNASISDGQYRFTEVDTPLTGRVSSTQPVNFTYKRDESGKLLGYYINGKYSELDRVYQPEQLATLPNYSDEWVTSGVRTENSLTEMKLPNGSTLRAYKGDDGQTHFLSSDPNVKFFDESSNGTIKQVDNLGVDFVESKGSSNVSAWDKYVSDSINRSSNDGEWKQSMSTYYDSTTINGKKVGELSGANGTSFYGEANMDFYVRTPDGKLTKVSNKNPDAETYSGLKDNVIIDVDSKGKFINWSDDGKHLVNDRTPGQSGYKTVDMTNGQLLSDEEAKTIIKGEKLKTGDNVSYLYPQNNTQNNSTLSNNSGTTTSAWDKYVSDSMNRSSNDGEWHQPMSTFYDSTTINGKKVGELSGANGTSFYGEANMDFYVRTPDGKLTKVSNKNPDAATYSGPKDNVIIDVDSRGKFINWSDDGKHLANDRTPGQSGYKTVDMTNGQLLSDEEAKTIIKGEKLKTGDDISYLYPQKDNASNGSSGSYVSVNGTLDERINKLLTVDPSAGVGVGAALAAGSSFVAGSVSNLSDNSLISSKVSGTVQKDATDEPAPKFVEAPAPTSGQVGKGAPSDVVYTENGPKSNGDYSGGYGFKGESAVKERGIHGESGNNRNSDLKTPYMSDKELRDRGLIRTSLS